MYELIHALGDSWYIESPAKIGLVSTGEGEVCLIDSGNDKDAGKKVKRILDSNGWSLRAIYCTHSHADHIGGCRYLQDHTGCRVYVCGPELGFCRYPVLETTLLYGGDPPEELRNKFLMAQTCEFTELDENSLPAGWEMLPLPGHTSGMTGFKTGDGVLYLGDALMGREALEKHPVSYFFDIGESLKTLEKLKTVKARIYVPAHSEALDEIEPLAQYNIDTINEVAGKIEGFCSEPVLFDHLLKKVFDEYGIPMVYMQHELIGSTVRSYLTWLTETGRLRYEAQDNLLYWEKV